ncbi:MAG: flavodoxin-dependent (E)-4-hydroxy-3-methylbut-2-enyl-diphosphate synthase [Candidatus Omnitrophica bacterium]|nr:flavodoxin-dependent (E)-4-hydroxy-3-methylbut-2-enyl-diphosphate synthase [Candidatus Omnitrophota bacterium]MCM8798191.1 flavodoxin-dependent (E)-4-hydroxy-3-methylbut-2-enyl-diphosphate synthase [Candidatus Omnitrophota bacterium]
MSIEKRIKRRKTRVVMVGNIGIGGNYPIVIQSMVKTKTSNLRDTINQIKDLEKVGCEIIRVAVKDEYDARAIKEIKKEIKIPLEADIHFHYQLALQAVAAGSDAIRLNPGNIYREKEIKAIVSMVRERKVPVRVGVNSGSLRGAVKNNSQPISTRMVKSALNYIRILERIKFYEIMVSLKASDVLNTVEAYQRMAKLCDYPFHLGITATGLPFEGGIKSALGIGILLAEGIGDTLRVSLAGDPKEEVKVAQWILSSLGLRQFGPCIIACPTCGRAQIDVVKITQELEKKLLSLPYSLMATSPLRIAIMGCEVNGPGEASDADIGIAGGKHCAVLFKKGKIAGKLKEGEIISVLVQKISDLIFSLRKD